MAGDLDADNVKVMKNPLHSMAGDVLPSMERSAEEISAACRYEVQPNAGAGVSDIDSSIDMFTVANSWRLHVIPAIIVSV